MDAITSLALSVDNQVIRSAGELLANDLAYGALVLVLVFAGEARNDKRLKTLLSLALVLLLCTAVKQLTAHPRPCAGLDWCPVDYSFPSLHAAVAFALAIAFLGKRSYPLYLLFALFVSFTRLNLGVHVFMDVAAALPLAMLSCYAVSLAWRAKGMDGGWKTGASGRKLGEGGRKKGDGGLNKGKPEGKHGT